MASPLVEQYKSQMADLEESDPGSQDPDQKRAKHIVDWVEWLQGAHLPGSGFTVSVQRIELLSSGLIGE